MVKANSSRFIWIAIGIAAVICLFSALGLLYFALTQTDAASSGMTGSLAPDFDLPSLNGHSLSLAHLRGKPVLINFWATWCDPCIAELPLLEAAAQRYDAELVVIGINEGDPFHDVERFIERESLSYTILLDYDTKVGMLYQVNGYPTSIFIDAEGIVRAIYLGEIPAAQLEKNLRLIGIK